MCRPKPTSFLSTAAAIAESATAELQNPPPTNCRIRRICQQIVAAHRRIRPQFPRPPRRPFLRRQESHNVVPQTPPKSANNPPSPRSSFLRRQESHNVVPQTPPNPPTNPPSPRSSFLRRQESHNQRRQHRIESRRIGEFITTERLLRLLSFHFRYCMRQPPRNTLRRHINEGEIYRRIEIIHQNAKI